MTQKKRKVKSTVPKLEPKVKESISIEHPPGKERIDFKFHFRGIIFYTKEGEEYCYIPKIKIANIIKHNQKLTVNEKTKKINPGGFFLVINALGSPTSNYFFNKERKKRDQAYKKIKSWMNRGRITFWFMKKTLKYEVDYGGIEESKK